ncbi:MAG: thiamine pyrophosphate-dependent enzyme [Candidatus Kapabacteria bacterium]|nr:thiamine pyrophosphate-dependent enzyme [Candidatus Kapabacteria bacterium]
MKKKTASHSEEVGTTVRSAWKVNDVLRDYRLAVESRQASILGRKEVLTGKAKFGIFGDGKELPQLAMAKAFMPGDWRSGYYRDQTFMFAIEQSDVQKFFAQLYAHTDVVAEPASAGRSMNGHFGTRFLNDDGSWRSLVAQPNVSADVSPTASQMPRLVGLAYASRLYREVEELKSYVEYSRGGSEVAFGTIGNASSAEGMFWESINAIGVLGAPAVISIWDDGYGISVPNEYQVTKSDVGELLRGFQRIPGKTNGFDIHVVHGWDYPSLVATYQRAASVARIEHIPQIIHVIEVTQPQGHSTSGSHERYKSPERLAWEAEMDGIGRMRAWIVQEGISTLAELDKIDEAAVAYVLTSKQAAWKAYSAPIASDVAAAVSTMGELADALREVGNVASADLVTAQASELQKIREPFRRDVMVATHKALLASRSAPSSTREPLALWRRAYDKRIAELYSSHLLSESATSPLRVPVIHPTFDNDAISINGSEIIRAWFDQALASEPRLLIFGEDSGKLGDVNQGTLGLQAVYGELRVGDTGIRECTILGQAIGLAMRGLRPVAEIQYLDYLLYALQLISDDLATVQWRTKGGQKAPVIIRTRGHRLEGVWHSGSPMAGIINLVRGVHLCVPRNFVQAAGMYQTLLQGDDPAIVVEVLNGYRLKEKLPANLGTYTVELGVPEVVRSGTDLTLVTYGATVRTALDAAIVLEQLSISVEVVDVQTLLPFDRHSLIVESLKKTNRLLVVDEDVPGGAGAYILREIVEVQNGFQWLDSAPRTLSAKSHRPAYGTDGNYWSKPEAEHIVDTAYAMLHEANPQDYPMFS